jgi:hypothetical protein
MIERLTNPLRASFYGWRIVAAGSLGHRSSVIAGAVYDRYQSYAPLMSTFIATALLAARLYAFLKKPALR